MEYQTIRSLGGEVDRIPTRMNPGEIQFVINPQHGIDMDNYEIELPEGNKITVFVNSIRIDIQEGKAVQICSGLTNQ